MEKFILIFQILISGILIALILLQPKSGGLGSAFGGGEFRLAKRGPEKVVFVTTIFLVILFLLGAILNTLISLR
jgi:protein translocase SecG subunit